MVIDGIKKCDFNNIPWYMFLFTYYEIGYSAAPKPYLPGMPYDSTYKRGCVTVRSGNEYDAKDKARKLLPEYSTVTYTLEIPGLARRLWGWIKRFFTEVIQR
jgi:hypothetical protein